MDAILPIYSKHLNDMQFQDFILELHDTLWYIVGIKARTRKDVIGQCTCIEN